jgi:hypothetical protein
LLGTAMKGVAHFNSLRRRAKTSEPGTTGLAPDSISASRRAANSSHARSRARSASRLATTLSSSLERASVGSCSTSSARASTGRGIMTPGVLDSYCEACHNGRRKWARVMMRRPNAMFSGACDAACRPTPLQADQRR